MAESEDCSARQSSLAHGGTCCNSGTESGPMNCLHHRCISCTNHMYQGQADTKGAKSPLSHQFSPDIKSRNSPLRLQLTPDILKGAVSPSNRTITPEIKRASSVPRQQFTPEVKCSNCSSHQQFSADIMGANNLSHHQLAPEIKGNDSPSDQQLKSEIGSRPCTDNQKNSAVTVEVLSPQDSASQGDCNNCKQCDEPNPTSICLQCRTELCQKCQERHLRFPPMKHHIIIPMERAHEKEASPDTVCPAKSRDDNFSNSRAGSPECVNQEQSGKSLEDTIIERSKAQLDLLSEKQDQVKARLEQIEKFRSCYDKYCEAAKRDIEDQMKKVIDKLKNDSTKLKAFIDTYSEEKLEQLESDQKELENQFYIQQNLLNYMNKVLAFKEKEQVENKLQSGLYHGLESCVSNTVVRDFDTETNPCFRADPVLMETNLLGQVTFDSGSYLEIKLKEADPPMEGTIIANSEEVCSNTPGECQECIAQSTEPEIESFRLSPVSLDTFVAQSMKPIKDFKINGRCNHFSYVNDTLWCPCDESLCYIQVYSTAGKLLRAVKTSLIQTARAVHPGRHENVLVAAANGLFSMTIDGKEVNQMLTGDFKDVNVHKSVVAALELSTYAKERVFIIDATTSSGKPRDFPLESNLSRRILVVDDHLIISFHGYQQSYVSMYTLKGEKIHHFGQLGSLGPGEFNQPLLCGWGSEISLLVADRDNKQLQVLDRERGWRVVKPPGWKWNMCPLDVIITSGQEFYILYCNIRFYSAANFSIKHYQWL